VLSERCSWVCVSVCCEVQQNEAGALGTLSCVTNDTPINEVLMYMLFSDPVSTAGAIKMSYESEY
jgi:hypothetical protein